MSGQLLIDACKEGNVDQARRALGTGTVDVHWKNDLAIRTAIEHGNVDVLAFLLKRGADVEDPHVIRQLDVSQRHQSTSVFREILGTIIRHSLADAPRLQRVVVEDVLDGHSKVLTVEMLAFCIKTLYPRRRPRSRRASKEVLLMVHLGH